MDINLYCISFSIALGLLFIKLLFTFPKGKSNLPPSPGLSLPIIGHLYLFKKPLHQTLASLSCRHSPILHLRFGVRPVLVVSSAALAEECFTKNDIALASRPQLPTTKELSYNYISLGSAPYGPHWRNIRRIATVEVLSAHRLNSFTDVRASEVRAMLCGLFSDSSDGFTKVEMRSKLYGLSLNVILTMVSGRSFYGKDASGSVDEVRRFKEIVKATASLAGTSNLQNFLPVLKWLDLKGINKKIRRVAEERNTFLQGLIEEHRTDSEAEKKKRTMIGELLSMQKSDPNYYTDEIIKALINSLLSAGTDTTSVTIEWALSLLINNPEILKKAQAEMDTHLEKGLLLQESDLANLPYLNCIISEALRLYPAAPLLLPHHSTEECTVGGFTIPSSTMVLCNAYTIHRDSETWVEPLKFMPERFEAEKGEHGGHGMIPFGMGRRRCPGEGLAMRVVGLVLGSLIQWFEWERIGTEYVDMREGSGLTLPKAAPLEALYKPRQTMMDVLSTLGII